MISYKRLLCWPSWLLVFSCFGITKICSAVPDISTISCTIPDPPNNGRFVKNKFFSSSTGENVDVDSILEVKCLSNHTLVGAALVKCQGTGSWDTFPDCKRMCRPLKSTTTRLSCRYKGADVSCCGLQHHGTSVMVSCKQGHANSMLVSDKCDNGYWNYPNQECHPICGQTAGEATVLVLGGREAKPSFFPWHAVVYQLTISGYVQICGGTIVSNRFIISAGHCFYDERINRAKPAGIYLIAVGKMLRTAENVTQNPYVQFIEVMNIVVPNSFKGDRIHHQSDIALLQLQGEIEFNQYVHPICLNYEQSTSFCSENGTLARVPGMGLTTEGGLPSEELRYIEVPVIDVETCMNSTPTSFHQYLTNDKLCAGYLNGTSVCNGDSGGGLVFSSAFQGKTSWYLLGIVSTGVPSTTFGFDSCRNDTYSAFTCVSSHARWIQQNIHRLETQYIYGSCMSGCNATVFGCCPDGETASHGLLGEGCCLLSQYGCCQENILLAKGPNYQGCDCQWTPHGCCPDNQSAAKGTNHQGCGCQYTVHGCCEDGRTPASGSNFQGCPCYTHKFGCCPDGKRAAQGPGQLGCDCPNTEHGCCPDGTPATRAGGDGCDCASSLHGCCLDGISKASGEDFVGCEEKPKNLQAACYMDKDAGGCKNFNVSYWFDNDYGGCSRFWYGGCGGNMNRFKTQDECNDACIDPPGKDVCKLPKPKSPCSGADPKWYYDNEQKKCLQFVYGGCLGNKNRFDSEEDCRKLCSPIEEKKDKCTQEADKGLCNGNYTRWFFDSASQTCSQFTWGGCRGNSNRFPTETACMWECKNPNKIRDVCLLPRATGSCTKKIPKWSFEQESKRCMPFYYTGCEGNGNRFDSEIDCEKACPGLVS